MAGKQAVVAVLLRNQYVCMYVGDMCVKLCSYVNSLLWRRSAITCIILQQQQQQQQRTVSWAQDEYDRTTCILMTRQRHNTCDACCNSTGKIHCGRHLPLCILWLWMMTTMMTTTKYRTIDYTQHKFMHTVIVLCEHRCAEEHLFVCVRTVLIITNARMYAAVVQVHWYGFITSQLLWPHYS